MKRTIVLALLGVLALSGFAEARPRKKLPSTVEVAETVNGPTLKHDNSSVLGVFLNSVESPAPRASTTPPGVKTVDRTVPPPAGPLSAKAYQYMGMNAAQLGLPRSLWCADFINKLAGGSDRRAISYAHRGTPASYGCVDCVVVTGRKRGEHVGIVVGYDSRGNLITISGNHSKRVGIGTYSPRSVISYRNV